MTLVVLSKDLNVTKLPLALRLGLYEKTVVARSLMLELARAERIGEVWSGYPAFARAVANGIYELIFGLKTLLFRHRFDLFY